MIHTILDAERRRQRLSVTALAERSGVPYSRLHGVLTGNTASPTFPTVQKVLAGLGRSLTWLDRRIKSE